MTTTKSNRTQDSSFERAWKHESNELYFVEIGSLVVFLQPSKFALFQNHANLVVLKLHKLSVFLLALLMLYQIEHKKAHSKEREKTYLMN